MYASGVLSYGYMGPEDRILVNLPMFHVGGTNSIFTALVRGASFYLVDSFDSRTFWEQIRKYRCTTTSGLIGAMTEFLAKAPPAEGERDNPLKIVTLGPVTPQTVVLAERYGFSYMTGFNMTEVSVPLVAELNTRAFGSCGKPRAGIECRLVDENDMRGAGGADRRADRAHRPALVDDDRLLRHAGGDRQGLAQRLVPHRRCVPARCGRQLLLRRPREGRDPPPRREHLVVRGGATRSRPIPTCRRSVRFRPQRAARTTCWWSVAPPPAAPSIRPELLRVPDPPDGALHGAALRAHRTGELPKTPTNKVQKPSCAAEGVTPDTWDRDAAGILVKREKLRD
jgi:crotonobetaine/carnitine-CoA ligase